jgi:hypothetical protein
MALGVTLGIALVLWIAFFFLLGAESGRVAASVAT